MGQNKKKFIIDVVDSLPTDYPEHDDKTYYEREWWNEFLQLADALKISNFALNMPKVVCGKCGSFSVDVMDFNKLLDTMFADAEGDLWDGQMDFAYDISYKLIKPSHMTDIEFNQAMMDADPIYDSQGNELFDEEGKPLKYNFDEVVIRFDEQCESCIKLFN